MGDKFLVNNPVKVRSHPRATTDDFIDCVRLSVRKNPNLIIFNTGSNDIQNNVTILLNNTLSSNKKYDTDDNIKIACLVLFIEMTMISRIKLMRHRKLETLCKGKGMSFINVSNIDSTCLNRSKLHLNKSGTSLLIKNFSKEVNSV